MYLKIKLLRLTFTSLIEDYIIKESANIGVVIEGKKYWD